MHILSEVFGFYVEKIFLEAFIYHRVDKRHFPLQSLEKLVKMTEAGPITSVFHLFIPGWYKQFAKTFANVERVKGFLQPLQMISEDPKTVSVYDIEKIKHIYIHARQLQHNNLYYQPLLTQFDYFISFCRNDEKLKRLLVKGFLAVNEAGLSYAHLQKSSEKTIAILQASNRRGAANPIALREILDNFEYYCLVCIVWFIALFVEGALLWGIKAAIQIFVTAQEDIWKDKPTFPPVESLGSAQRQPEAESLHP